MDESAADPTAPAQKSPRSGDTEAAEAAASGDGSEYQRRVPEADMLALSDPAQFTDVYVPMSVARELKVAAGLQDSHIEDFDLLTATAKSYVANLSDPPDWTGTKKFAGPFGVGHVATAGNCGCESFAVGWHLLLMSDRGVGVARHRDSISTGIESVDADMHFDPVISPYGQEHQGRVFQQAVTHVRRKMEASIASNGWWDENKDAARACYGDPKAPNPGQPGYRETTKKTVIDAIVTDREWTGDFELGILADAFKCAVFVHDYRGDGTFGEPRGPCGDPAGPLIQMVYDPKGSHYYPIVGASDQGYGDCDGLAAPATVAQTQTTTAAHGDGESEPTLRQQLEHELESLMSESHAWDKAGTTTAGTTSDMLIDVTGSGKKAYARTLMKKVWGAAQELRGADKKLSKDRLTKIVQNSATTASAATVASPGDVDFSNDVLGMHADVAMGFSVKLKVGNKTEEKYKLYIGQIDKMVIDKPGGGKELYEKHVPFDDVPDNLGMRCTWYGEGKTLSSGAVEFTLGSAGGGEDDSNYNDKQSLLGIARLEVRTQLDADGASTVLRGHFTMDKEQHAELMNRLSSLKPKVQEKAAQKTKAAAQKAAAAKRKAEQSAAPDTRGYKTTSESRRQRRNP